MTVTSLNQPNDGRHHRYPIKASGIIRTLFQIAKQRGLTLKALSIKIGVSSVTLSTWRQGKAIPSLFMLECLAEVLGYEITLKEKYNVPSNS
jgi:transcriptional regulator with XRE-family HTH domain